MKMNKLMQSVEASKEQFYKELLEEEEKQLKDLQDQEAEQPNLSNEEKYRAVLERILSYAKELEADKQFKEPSSMRLIQKICEQALNGE